MAESGRRGFCCRKSERQACCPTAETQSAFWLRRRRRPSLSCFLLSSRFPLRLPLSRLEHATRHLWSVPAPRCVSRPSTFLIQHIHNSRGCPTERRASGSAIHTRPPAQIGADWLAAACPTSEARSMRCTLQLRVRLAPTALCCFGWMRRSMEG
jgi:hypothetical protein